MSQRAIEFLKDHESGRGGFIPLQTKHPSSSLKLNGPGIVGTALDLVAYDPAYSDIARTLLSDVVVVEDLMRRERLCCSAQARFEFGPFGHSPRRDR